MTNVFMKIGNAFFASVLRSPLHGTFSRTILLITVKGKSGREYTTPVGYAQEGVLLRVTSTRDRWWWKNLRGGAMATLLLKGKLITAHGIVKEKEGDVAEGLEAYLRGVPQYAKNFGVRMVDGEFDRDDISRVSKNIVIVELTPSGQ